MDAHCSFLTPGDLHMFNEGTHFRLYEKLGAHPCRRGDIDGVHFAVWAPNAEYVSVVGDFNRWNKNQVPLSPQGNSGIWEGFVPGITPGTLYKYHIQSRFNLYSAQKADPFAFASEVPPATASVVWDLAYTWNDEDWMAARGGKHSLEQPIAIYEVHPGSWKRVTEDQNRSLSYRELAEQLVEYVKKMGFTHVEFLPVMEHPFFGSWGYQTTGLFRADQPLWRPAGPHVLIDCLHQNGIGVILDWVPSHFPCDEHGLAYFDGTHLYEHADPRQGVHRIGTPWIFNYGRHEV